MRFRRCCAETGAAIANGFGFVTSFQVRDTLFAALRLTLQQYVECEIRCVLMTTWAEQLVTTEGTMQLAVERARRTMASPVDATLTLATSLVSLPPAPSPPVLRSLDRAARWHSLIGVLSVLMCPNRRTADKGSAGSHCDRRRRSELVVYGNVPRASRYFSFFIPPPPPPSMAHLPRYLRLSLFTHTPDRFHLRCYTTVTCGRYHVDCCSKLMGALGPNIGVKLHNSFFQVPIR